MSSFSANLRCPDDGHLLRADASGAVPFAVCRHCHGLFFTAAALARAFDDPPAVPDASRRWRAARPPHDRACPACNATLGRHRLDGIEIDRCVTCHGIWLDPGEFDAARIRLRASSPPRPTSSQGAESAAHSTGEDVLEIVLHILAS